MWIEKINVYIPDNSYIKPRVGVKLSVVKRAERKLKIKFPEELKSLLLEVNGDNYLLLSAQQIVEDNLSCRKAYREVYDGLENLLFIGCNGCGDYYAYRIIDKVIASTEIVKWEHEDNSSVTVACGLSDLIERYYTGQI